MLVASKKLRKVERKKLGLEGENVRERRRRNFSFSVSFSLTLFFFTLTPVLVPKPLSPFSILATLGPARPLGSRSGKKFGRKLVT